MLEVLVEKNTPFLAQSLCVKRKKGNPDKPYKYESSNNAKALFSQYKLPTNDC
jgi:hypothetical protein